ncbi:transposable element Tcb1 transposase [Trichonephila clavipes]|nr:transposable element Tcb1 transposase [Trichonephila clavipes]
MWTYLARSRPRVTSPKEDRYLAVTPKETDEHNIRPVSRQLSSATGTTVLRQTVYRRLRHIGLYARRPVRCVPLPATHCRLRLTWSTRYHQENTIERHRYGGAGWLVWGGIILGSRTDLHVQSVTMTGHIYRDVILEQHVRLFRGAMDAEFLFMDDNARPHRANIVDECLQSEDITRMDWPAYSPDLNPIEHVCQVIYSQFAFAINQNDHQARRRFVEWAQNEIAVVPDFHKRILFSDEAHFWLNGYVNKQNCRIWSEANTQVYVETPLHPEKLTVWCALWAGGIIGPYFFKNDEGHNVTVNGDRYRAMI